MGNKIKELRGQLRQIVKEVLPELLVTELKSALYAGLTKVISARLDAIQEDVKKTMDEINSRSKDVQDYMVRNITSPIDIKKQD